MRGPVVTRSRLIADLTALGVGDWPAVMVHTRMSAIGWVVGGAPTVIDALMSVLGDRGTLVVLTGWQDRPPYHQETWTDEERQAYMDECPAFDPGRSMAERNHGRVPETVRTWPGACHSAHPVGGFAALGADAAWFASGQSLDEAYGSGSPLERLVERGGAVLLLGAPPETVTLLHYAEYLAAGKAKRWVEYDVPVLLERRRVWRHTRELDSSRGAFRYEGLDLHEDEFAVITKDALDTGIGRSGAVGAAASHLLPATDLVAHAVRWLERHFPE